MVKIRKQTITPAERREDWKKCRNMKYDKFKQHKYFCSENCPIIDVINKTI